jgi:hypothetical protein
VRARLLILGLLATSLAAPAANAAVRARPMAMFEDHRHNTGGNDWHIQMQAGRHGRGLTSLVLYAAHCDVTRLATGLTIAPDGSFAAGGGFDHGRGHWSVRGAFTDADNARGTWSVTDGTCAVADHPFAAHDAHGHFIVGNERPYAPLAIRGPSPRASRLRAIKRATVANAYRWATLASAADMGYVVRPGEFQCPGLFHARKHSNYMWGRVLDPAAPQGLVFWCDTEGQSRVVAAMYRVPAKKTPDTFGELIQWHRHNAEPTWMTHIWLVPDPRAAFATCAPFNALASAGLAQYAPYVADIPIDEPCPGTPGYTPAAPTR